MFSCFRRDSRRGVSRREDAAHKCVEVHHSSPTEDFAGPLGESLRGGATTQQGSSQLEELSDGLESRGHQRRCAMLEITPESSRAEQQHKQGRSRMARGSAAGGMAPRIAARDNTTDPANLVCVGGAIMEETPTPGTAHTRWVSTPGNAGAVEAERAKGDAKWDKLLDADWRGSERGTLVSAILDGPN
ncbi:unnamed protein product [Pedinophyceae sp. YPF-701]|nr:unnamed protein product [Pedinophyceae sp. YPF-701]